MEPSQQVMERIRQAFTESGLSLDELGRRMDYPVASARKSAWQFIHRTMDPRLSMVYRFAKAVDLDVAELVNNPRGR